MASRIVIATHVTQLVGMEMSLYLFSHFSPIFHPFPHLHYQLIFPKMRLRYTHVPLLSAFLLFLIVVLTPTPSTASVIGIDYGSEWFKVSIVKPGIPLDIVLNHESKRKTPTVVLVRNGDRRYGSDAVALVCSQCFGDLQRFLGVDAGLFLFFVSQHDFHKIRMRR